MQIIADLLGVSKGEVSLEDVVATDADGVSFNIGHGKEIAISDNFSTLFQTELRNLSGLDDVIVSNVGKKIFFEVEVVLILTIACVKNKKERK